MASQQVTRSADSRDRCAGADEGLRRQAGRRRARLHRQAGCRDGVSRAERVREVDDDAADPGARCSHLGRDDGQREALSRPRRSAARGRCAPRSAVGAHRPLRLQPPARARPDPRHSPFPRRRADRPRRPSGGCAQASRQVLARDGAAARDRVGADRRPADRDARRAGQRARPGRDPLDAQPPARVGSRGTNGVRLLPPDERDGVDRRPPDRGRPRPA